MERDITYKVLRRIYRFIKNLFWVLNYKILTFNHITSARFSRRSGITSVKRNPELVVSLTTIPERIGSIHLCIDSLLRQDLKPDRLILWLSESAEPNRPGIVKSNLPVSILRLLNRGLEIRWCEDIRSYRKLIPTLQIFPNSLIVTADDDIYYPQHWLQMLYKAYQREPQYVHCHRAHLIRFDSSGSPLPYRQWNLLSEGTLGPSMDLFPTSGGGVLYAPGHLHPEVLNESAFLNLSPNADDIWFYAMTNLANVASKKVAGRTFKIFEIKIPNNRTLSSDNFYKDGNDLQIICVTKKYGVFARH